LNAQLGTKSETTYGTAVVVDRFWAFERDTLKPIPGRTEADGELRPGSIAMGVDQFVPYDGGAEGEVELIVPTKGMGWWLDKAIGTAVSIGAPTDSNSLQTYTPGVNKLAGKSWTHQRNTPFNPGGGDQAITFAGVKCDSFEFSMELDDFLRFVATLDGQTHSTATALATASYPSFGTLGAGSKFPWSLAAITIGGSQVETTLFKFRCDNNLKTDRRYLRGSALKKEPVRNGKVTPEFELEVDWVDLTQYTRIMSATANGACAQIVATFSGPVALAGATVPQLV
ncbi:unnamed protein product, partial [Phaeothamnion confervicola]